MSFRGWGEDLGTSGNSPGNKASGEKSREKPVASGREGSVPLE